MEKAGFFIIAVIVGALSRLRIIQAYSDWFRQHLVGDAAFHYCVIRSLQQPRHYEGVPEFLIRRGPDTYPLAFHRFASLFPIAWLKTRPYLPNLIVFVVFFSVFVLYLLELAPTPSTLVTFLAAVIFLTAASNIVHRGDSILYVSLSERLLARLSVGLFFLGVTTAMEGWGVGCVVVASIAGGVALCTSMFSRQALLLSSPLLALIQWDATPLITLTGAFGLAVLFSPRRFLRGLGDQYKFIVSYNRHTKQSRFYKGMLSRYVSWQLLFSSGAGIGKKLAELEGKEPTQAIFRSPESIAFAILFILADLPNMYHFFALLMATFFLYLIISTPFLRHLGEGVRYIEYNLAFVGPLALALGLVAAPFHLAILVGSAYFVWVLLVLVASQVILRRMQIPTTDVLGDFLHKAAIGKEAVIFTVPVNLAPSITARTGAATVCYPGVYGSWFFEEYIEEFPFLKRNWWDIVNRHGVTHILVDKIAAAEGVRILGWHYDFGCLKTVREDPRYLCYGLDVHPSPVPSVTGGRTNA